MTAVNDAPAGSQQDASPRWKTRPTRSDGGRLRLQRPATPANALAAVKITTLPGAGTLTNNGVAVNAGDFITAADISAGMLVFRPAANANGAAYATFTFQVQDDGGTPTAASTSTRRPTR